MGDLFSREKNILLSSLVFSLLLSGIALAFQKHSWAAGLVLGAITGNANFYFLSSGFTKAFRHTETEGHKSAPSKTMSPGSQPWALTGKFFIRYLFLSSAFFLAFKTPWIHFLSFVLGFFIVHLHLGASGLIQFIRSSKC